MAIKKKQTTKKAKPAKVKKTLSKSAKKPVKIKEKMAGKVEHYFDRINVVTMTLKNPLKVGDIVHVKGHTTDFIQKVESMQIEHVPVQKAKKGEGVGIKVDDLVRDTDVIYFADKKSIAAAKAKAGQADLSQQKPASENPGSKFLSF